MNYFEINAISNSDLKWFKKSPAHYKWYKENPPAPTKDMNFGTLIHMMLLEASKVFDVCFVFDESQRPEPDKDYRTKVNAEWKKQVFEENYNKLVFSQDEYDLAEKIVEGVYKNPDATDLIMDAKNRFEQCFTWEHLGVNCKAKLDITNPAFNADIKTCQDASPQEFIKNFMKLDYYRQAAIYNFATFGKDYAKKPFYFIAVEKSAPYGCAVYKVTQEALEYGFNEYEELIERFDSCRRKDVWPGYEILSLSGVIDLDIPNYMKV